MATPARWISVTARMRAASIHPTTPVQGSAAMGWCRVANSVTWGCGTGSAACEVAAACTGTSAYCPANTFKASSTVCRPVARSCDVAETCTGTSAYCPLNGVQPAGTACDDGNPATCHDQCTAGGSCIGTAC